MADPRTCPACGHDLDTPAPDPPPKQPHCPCNSDTCLVCTVTVHLDGDIDTLTQQLREHLRGRPLH